MPRGMSLNEPGDASYKGAVFLSDVPFGEGDSFLVLILLLVEEDHTVLSVLMGRSGRCHHCTLGGNGGTAGGWIARWGTMWWCRVTGETVVLG